uniref:F-box domain-containing protein n=1 Tax=Meloidogyne enterolobii TaxID=390850 RepID=A0A6V7TSI0_MELEN|nr:unnamed protein product [Meloidogyne enterolobii]
MLSLPIEVQLDVLKCLNFNQLFSVKQTNFYFYNFISGHEVVLAGMKFSNFLLTNDIRRLKSYKFIEPHFGLFEFTLNDQLKKKWQSAINESIPLFLKEFGSGLDFFICIVTGGQIHISFTDSRNPSIISQKNFPFQREGRGQYTFVT